MANELGHMSAEIALDINPFLNNQRVLESQINRTSKMLNQMETSFKNGLSSIGKGNIFSAQISQLGMLDKQLDIYKNKLDKIKQDFSANPTVDNQRALGTVSTQLETTSLKYDQLRLAAARNLQQQRQENSFFGRLSSRIGDTGDRLLSTAQNVRSFGSAIGSAALGGALGNAAQQAMSFKSEIQQIGPLLSNTGEITGQVQQELNTMSSASLDWSRKYGIATTDINQAMSELVRRGFTAQQTLGSMPAILDASRASGESLGVVMQATASAIEMFGLKANTTEEQLKNTQHVTDVLTMAANKTASSFEDISAAMTYVGPTAASAHMSIEQTAAALGILSNKGIEASTAGTTLRQVISRLTTDTKENRTNMQAIGVDIDEIRKKGIDLPDIIDKVNNKLKDKTPTEKMALLNAAFGKLGQGVMAMFEKSSKGSKSAGDELRNLESELENAGGVTKKVADEMNQTPQAKWDQFKQSIHALAIEVGGNVLPAFKGFMDFVKNIADGFSRLSPQAQSAVVSFGLLYASIKPLTSLIAGPFEGIGNLLNLIKGFADSRAVKAGGSLADALKRVDSALQGVKGVQGATELTKIGTSAEGAAAKSGGLISKLKGIFTGGTKAASAATTVAAGTAEMGAATAGAEVASGGLASTLGSMALGLVAVAGAVAIAYGGFKLWTGVIQPAIAKQQEHEKEMGLWGAVVGRETSKSAQDFSNWSSKATAALDQAQINIKGSADKIKDSFKGMGDAVEKNLKTNDKALKNLSKFLGGIAGASVEDSRQYNAKKNQSIMQDLQKQQQMANAIVDEAARHGGKMSADTRQTLSNIQANITDMFVKTLGTTRSAQKHIQEAIQGTFSAKISKEQILSQFKEFNDAFHNNVEHTKLGMEKLKDAYKNGQLSFGQYVEAKKALQKDDEAASERLLEGTINLRRATGSSWSQIRDQLMKSRKDWGITADEIDQAMKKVQNAGKSSAKVVADTASKMSDSAKKAGKDWNSLVLDPKTGKVKTNLQEVLNDTAKTKDGWASLVFDYKHAKISSNAKQMIIEAAFASGQWNSMSFKEQRAMITSNAGKEIADALQKAQQWNNMSPKVQKLIVTSKNRAELFKGLQDLKTWNSLNPDQKQLIISQFTGFDKLKLELQNIKEWNALPTDKKQAVIETITNGGSLTEALKQVGIWNALPTSMQKNIEVLDNGSIQKVQSLNGLLNNFSGKNYQSTFEMKFKGMQDMKNGLGLQQAFNKTPDSSKTNTMNLTGAGTVQDGTTKQKIFNSTPSSNKSNGIKTSGIGEVEHGTGSQRTFNGTRSSNKKNSISTSGIGQLANGIQQQLTFMQLKGHQIVNTIVTTVKKIAKNLGFANGTVGAWRYAYGTPNDGAPGGLSWVGDGGRKEVVYQPNSGSLFATPSAPTLVDLEKGAIVWRSVEAFERVMKHAGITQYPKFAEGTASQNLVAVANRIPDNADEQLRARANSMLNNNSQEMRDLQMQQNELLALLIEQTQQMAASIKDIGFSFNVNGRNLADATVEDNAKALSTYIKKSGMRFS